MHRHQIRLGLIGTGVLFLATGISQPGSTPSFEDYPVESIYAGPTKPPNFGDVSRYSGTDVRCFGGRPADYANAKVNFAGRYVIETCSCGAGCHYLFLWDAQTGKAYTRLPLPSINVGPYGQVAGLPAVEYKGEQYRRDSRLLIIEGCGEDTCDCAVRYFLWDRGNLRQILKRVASRMPPKCAK